MLSQKIFFKADILSLKNTVACSEKQTYLSVIVCFS